MITPKCLQDNHLLGHTARGYILPCCWADRPELFESDMKDLVKEKFKLINVKNIEDVIESDEWTQFYDKLKRGEGAKICSIYCKGKSVKIIEQ